MPSQLFVDPKHFRRAERTELVSMVTLRRWRRSLLSGSKGRMCWGWQWGWGRRQAQDLGGGNSKVSCLRIPNYSWEGDRVEERVGGCGGRLGHENVSLKKRWAEKEQHEHFKKEGVTHGALRFPPHTGMPFCA